MASNKNHLIDPIREIYENFSSQEICIDGVTLRTTVAFDMYWYFAKSRQDIFFSRLAGEVSKCLFEDPVLRSNRFTNAYRASDRVSQYLISNVILARQPHWTWDDVFLRIIIFKIFNKIETWEALQDCVGEISTSSFNFDAFDRVLTDRQGLGTRNYSAAYIMPSAGHTFGYATKHANHLALVRWMLDQKFPDRLRQVDRMRDAYDLLRTAPSLGPFLAYQYVTDLNYSELTDYSEMEFVVAGPGALDGISKCFIASEFLEPEKIISHMSDNQEIYFKRMGLDFKNLWGRPLQLIDCQNLFCEVSKYTRAAAPDIHGISGRSRIKQKYVPSKRALERPVYPQKWGINNAIDFSTNGAVTHHSGFLGSNSQACLF